jgi:hypothetical protein
MLLCKRTRPRVREGFAISPTHINLHRSNCISHLVLKRTTSLAISFDIRDTQQSLIHIHIMQFMLFIFANIQE